MRAYLSNLVDNFSLQFVVTLISVYAGLKGTAYQIILNTNLPFFRGLGIGGKKYQSVTVLSNSPWSCKALIGLISDVVPLYGYHKRSYIAFVSIIGVTALLLLWVIKFTSASAPLAASLLFLFNLQAACVDLLTEARYARMMVDKPHTGSDIVSFVWGLDRFGGLIGSLITGPIADSFDPRILYAIALPLAAQVVIPVLTGWFPEQACESSALRRDRLQAHPRLVRLSIAMTIGSLSVGLSAAFGSPSVQSSISIMVAITLAVLGMFWLPKMLGRVTLYLFINHMLYLSLPGAMDYFFTADSKCVPGGPAFSMTYYITWANIVASVAALAGVVIFQRFLRAASFRSAFALGIILKLLASMFDYILVKRLNVRYLGISDRVFFMLGDAVIGQVVIMLDLMPCIVLTSKVCPKGMEACVYALLVSYQNLATNIASTIGVKLIDSMGIHTTVPCNFDGLPMAIIIAHVILPAFGLPLIFLLIPNVRMTDDLINSEGEYVRSATVLPSGDSEVEPLIR